jgi:hypothetical protein
MSRKNLWGGSIVSPVLAPQPCSVPDERKVEASNSYKKISRAFEGGVLRIDTTILPSVVARMTVKQRVVGSNFI